MKTTIKFPSNYENVVETITPLVEKMLLGCPNISNPEVAVMAVAGAFQNADRSAGNGISNYGECKTGDFYATANISTGEFRLYHEIV